MICPEGAELQNDKVNKDVENITTSGKNIPGEGSSLDMKSFKTPKTWKKSFTNFFRNPLRSTKSNDGDHPSGSKDKFGDKEISPEQKWQSLGKIFKRQSYADNWSKSPNKLEDNSSKNKRLAVRNVLSSYFGKKEKTSIVEDE